MLFGITELCLIFKTFIMRKVLLLSYVFILGVILVSCGPPETYEKGMSYFQVQKYDSAMY